MIRVCWLLGLVWAAAAQTAEPTPAATPAEAGPAWRPGDPQGSLGPRRLRRAEDDPNDVRDGLILQHTLYTSITSDLTEERCAEMIEAAERRIERRKQEAEWTRELVELGALARNRLREPAEKLAWAEKELELARKRAELVAELAEMARAEQAALAIAPETPATDNPLAERFDGVRFRPADLARIEQAFQTRFLKPLPVSARGDTALHRALGFDHRDRLDVAVHPDHPEGVWLRNYLREAGIPYFAFRGSVPGKATGAHVHIGPPSERWTPAGDRAGGGL